MDQNVRSHFYFSSLSTRVALIERSIPFAIFLSLAGVFEMSGAKVAGTLLASRSLTAV